MVNSLSIFRDYDIRGIYPQEINEEIFFRLGKAIATYFEVSQIAVGRDCRLSSPSLSQALIEGILSSGTDVVDLGLISTEIHYFASGFYQFPANIIVSASHNPKEYNGLKIVKKGVVPLHGGFGLPEIKNIFLSGQFRIGKRKGKVKKENVFPAWINHVLKFIDSKMLSSLKVVIDAGNGMGGLTWEKLKEYLPLRIIPLYFEPNGNFPHHLPDPLNEKNLSDLKKLIIEKKADLGIALDGDADRVFILDEKGRMISGSILTAILAEALLKKYPGEKVLYNVVCGRIVPQTIKKAGGIPVRVRVGHSFIKETMKKNQAIFGGEHSGHFYFRENFFADSSTIAGLIFLEYFSQKNKPLSVVVKEFDIYPSSGEINFKLENSHGILEKIAKHFSDAEMVDYIDGLSVWYKDWWFNLRSSKTEPLLRLNIEADDKITLEKKKIFLIELLGKYGGQKL